MSANVTKAVLLAAGRGTRMRELTDELPKPMIAVQGKPILQHIIEGLAAAGRYRFDFVCTPLKLVGATGSPVRPLAIASEVER